MSCRLTSLVQSLLEASPGLLDTWFWGGGVRVSGLYYSRMGSKGLDLVRLLVIKKKIYIYIYIYNISKQGKKNKTN